ncbi:MAG: DUF128 domain-containing protein [Chloroflexota bacterium]
MKPAMVQSGTSDTERKIRAILQVLSESSEPLGSLAIAQGLQRRGIFLSERAVRYHLRMTDERGYTASLGHDGRTITPEGLEEVKMALAPEQVGFIIDKLEVLAFQTTFDPERRTGMVPINTSLFDKDQFRDTLAAMMPAFDAGLCVSELVATASEGQKLGSVVVPAGKVGLATVCSVVVNGTLLKACVPTESKFGGVLELKSHRPRRFVAVIHYSGTSLDPSEQYVRAGMTSVRGAAATGNGRVLANFREILAVSRPVVEEKLAQLKDCGINAVYVLGRTSESICQVSVGLNRAGMVLLGGLNPVACAAEAGYEVENSAESGLIDFERLVSIREL